MLKKTIIGLTVIVFGYLIFLEIYFFSDWEQPEKILPSESILEQREGDQSLLNLFDWQRQPILSSGKYIQQGSDERQVGMKAAPKAYVFDFPLGLSFAIPDKYNPLRWPQNDDTLNFICLGKNSRVDLSGFFKPHYDQAQCEEDYVQGAVMARVEGSGRFVRFWMTVGSAVLNLVDNEVLRVYVDDKPTPLIQVSLKEVFTGKAGEIFAAPFGAEDTTYIAWYYPIVFNSKFILAVDQLGPSDLYYHQTDVVLDAAPVNQGAAVVQKLENIQALPVAHKEPSAEEEPSAHKKPPANKKIATRKTIAKLLTSDQKHLSNNTEVLLQKSELTLSANETKTFIVKGRATIQSLLFEVALDDLPKLNASQLKITWDEQEDAAINIAVEDFFSTAFDQPSYKNKRSKGAISVEVAAVKEGGAEEGDAKAVYEFKLPMPFKSQAKIQISNNQSAFVLKKLSISGVKSLPAQAQTQTELELKTVQERAWGYLHAKGSNQKAPSTQAEHPVLNVKGQGRLMGVCAQLWGKSGEGFGSHLPYSFLEGDEMIRIDGEKRVQGTGTEDYFNSSFYYLHDYKDELFAQVWGKVDGPEEGERVSQCRWHILSDAIDFKEALKFDLEVGGRNPNAVLDYRTTAFYYLK